ncbi:AbrB/MazE/SpoVT family DNA-binding domain-containing protein [Candidatus Peregrinibacteria bacterium]|nr:AbrB/MazE/SpoVT family DNA-binding domain-containing protein [Candidatus Peregrinibacteria bacterium]
MSPKIVKSTSKGQVTLPKSWRDQFNTDNFLMQIEVNSITIKPINLDKLQAEDEVIFDADRDNNGKGVSPDEIIRMLKKISK